MRARIFTVFSTLFLILALMPYVLTLYAESADVESGQMEIANRSDMDGLFSCDVRLSGRQARGNVFAVSYAESGQMKHISIYPANETVKITVQDVMSTDYLKILWLDAKRMPMALPVVLRMNANNTKAYEKFAQDLAELKQSAPPAGSEAFEPYAMARLIVSASVLPDLSAYNVQIISGPDNLHILQFSSASEAEKCERDLKSDHSVRYAEPDCMILANGDIAAGVMGAENSYNSYSWGVSKTGIEEYAESLRKRAMNAPVTVAVVDSGVERNHPFLKDRLISGYDFVEKDSVPQDGHGHGTHVAGTIVDCTPGMNVNIMPVRVLDDNAGGTLLNIFLGIHYAADHGANIINLSLSLQSHSDLIEEAIRDVISKNITVVVAAGNYNANAAFYCPAHTRECITVAAVDSNLRRFERSNYGGSVDIAAPGVDINSSYPGGKFLEMSGTSMAAPHVSAAAALLINELGTGQTPAQIASAIRDAAKILPKDAGDFEWQRYAGNDFLGAGFLDMRPFIPAPENQFYALLYADGELVFQTNQTPDSNRTLIQTYPVSAAGASGEYAAWYNRRSDIRTVVFADTIRPSSTALWFYGCENLSEIRGIENLDTSEVTDMSQMFARCASLTKLDLSGLHTENTMNTRFMFFSCNRLAELNLSGWNTAKVTDMSDIFNSCAALKTVYVSNSFTVGNASNSVGIFSGCTSLVGGRGTKYDSSHTDATYARIDGGASVPGYFTDPNAPAPTNTPTPAPSNDVYALLYSDGELVFQYGSTPKRGGTVTGAYAVDMENGYYLNWSNSDQCYYSTAPWNDRRAEIKAISFRDKIAPRSVTGWFYTCRNLTEIENIRNLDTSNVTDMGWMFSECESLSSLDVSRFDTSNVTSMVCMFSGCRSLNSLNVSHFNTSNVTDMGWMFNLCSSLSSLDVSCFETSNVTDMHAMFSWCSSLSSLDVSRFDTSNVTDMGYMFDLCYRLNSLDVSRFDTSNVTDMGWMFSYCSGLTALDLSGFDTSNVTDMHAMFDTCRSLSNLDVSNFNTFNVTDMSMMFYNCNALLALNVSGFDTINVVDMGGMFTGCSGLTSLDISGFNTSNVTDMGVMFAGCSNLSSLNVSRFDTSNVTDMRAMFDGCSGLRSLNVSRFNTSNVTDMGAMFAGCSNLSSLDVSRFDTSNVTDMGGLSKYTFYGVRGMFFGCNNLESLDLSGWNTSKVTNTSSMFAGCTGMKKLNVSNLFVMDNVSDSEAMFSRCTSLIGGRGTKYDPNHTDASYARIDGGADNPGYFTALG